MRTALKLITASTAAIATPALAQPVDYGLTPGSVTAADGSGRPAGLESAKPEAAKGGLSFDLELGIANGRRFPQQRFDLTKATTFEGSLTVCKDTLCINFWTAQNNAVGGDETDVSLSKTFSITKKLEGKLQLGYFFLPGVDDVEGKVSLAYDLTKHCSVSGSFELIRATGKNGFNDTVVALEPSCEFTSGKTTIALGVGAAYGDYAGGVTPTFSGDITQDLGGGFRLKAALSGYVDNGKPKAVAKILVGLSF